MTIHGVQVQRRLISVDEYEQMIQAGVFHEDDRLELIEGELVTMSPIGAAHAGCVARLNRLLAGRVAGQALVFIQSPIRLARSEPEPVLALLRPRADDYVSALPGPADVLLVIEVAATSADYDRSVKLPLYGRAGIPEAWLLDLSRAAVEVYRPPSEAGCGQKQTITGTGRLSVQALDGVELGLDEIFTEA